MSPSRPRSSCPLWSAVVVFIFSLEARAFSVGSGASAACHELMIHEAFLDYICPEGTCSPDLPAGWELYQPDEHLDPATRKIMDSEFGIFSDRVKFSWPVKLAHYSLREGARYNDTYGNGISQFNDLRAIHLADFNQAEHCLRSTMDFGPDGEGDVSALKRCRGFIEEQIEEAIKAFERSSIQREEMVPVYIEFYGTINVLLWGGFFHLGRALHALQDSYSHTIRSDDLSRIYSITNYLSCIQNGKGIDHDLFGPCHSNAPDRCLASEVEPLHDAATDQTRLLLQAFTQRLIHGDQEAIKNRLDQALAFQPGCRDSIGYCGSGWVPLFMKEVSLTDDLWIANAIGCTTTGRGRDSSATNLLFALLELIFLHRMRRKAARR